jgi:RimJ/RimL family protein N-acetyltransferase
MKVPVLIEGVRLRLRQARPADAATLFALVDDDEVMRHMDWPRAHSVDETRAHLESGLQRWDAGLEHQYLVLQKPDATPVGSIAFRPHGFHVDFGYLVGRAHWGQGLATEAAQLLVQHLQRQPGVLRIWATCDADNSASAAVLKKAGLQFEGRLRRAHMRPNFPSPRGPEPRDTLMHAWVREEEGEASA